MDKELAGKKPHKGYSNGEEVKEYECLRAFVFRVWGEERLGKQITNMEFTEIKRDGNEDLKLYFEIL